MITTLINIIILAYLFVHLFIKYISTDLQEAASFVEHVDQSFPFSIEETLRMISRDQIFEYKVSLPSLPSIRNSIPLCQKVDSRILRKNTESLLTVYSGIL